MPSRKDIRDALVLMVVSVCVSLLYNSLSADGIALMGQWDTSKGVVTARSKNDVVVSSREINSVDDMKRVVEEKKRLIVDVRPREVYEQGHIPGAVNFPMNRFDEVIGDFLQKVDPAASVVLYCSGRECHDSHAFADQIVQFGYTEVNVFSGGFEDWSGQGLSVETGVENAG